MIARRVMRLLAVLGVALVALGGCRATAPGVYEHAAVAADHPLASAAGVRMLRYGGNAVDAAVATSFCLSVVRPHSCGIGGGGFMVIAFPPDTGTDPVAIDYRETAPAAVGPGYYEALGDERASVDGVRAAGVPGTVAGLLTVHERYGRLTRASVLAPAIRAAERGFVADANYVKAVEMARERREANPALVGPSDYIWTQLCRSGRVRVGDRITDPQQAYALRVLAAEGADAFYEGEIADAIAGMMEAEGGAITRADLAAYRPRITTPLEREVAGCDVLTMPPPSSGGIAILQVLGILETRGVAAFAPTDPGYVHEVTNALKHAYADRARWLADPAYATVPVDDLLAREYLAQLAARYDPDRPIAPDDAGSVPPEDGGTSHLCVVDAEGMAVACTETVNYIFGSMTSVPGYGFVLNDEMDDFTTRRGQANIYGLIQSDRNLPAAGKRPLSSMSPTIVLRGGAPYLVVGGSGGPRIITGTLQVMLNCWLWDMPPEDAVAAPRFHHQWQPDVLGVEETWTETAALDRLRLMGHAVEPYGDVGHVQVIRVDPDGLRAASDPRKGGAPNGY